MEEEYQSELIILNPERAPIAPAIPPEELAKNKSCFSDIWRNRSSWRNPDRIQSASATKWGKYNIEEMDELKKGEFMTIHAGFGPAAANDDPNVVLPLDVMKEYAKRGKIGGVYPYFYATGRYRNDAKQRRLGWDKKLRRNWSMMGLRPLY